MRIIAGTAKGRSVKTLEGRDVRPTTDRVKESLFNILGDLNGLTVMDLYCGSGNLGLEALSRGAACCWFVDSSAPALRQTTENALRLGFPDRAPTMNTDALLALGMARSRGLRFDLVLADPPYDDPSAPDLLNAVHWPDLLAPDHRLVWESSVRRKPALDPARWETTDERRYGETALTFLVLRLPEPPRPI